MPGPLALAGIGLGAGVLSSLFGGTNFRAPSAEDLQRMFGPGQLAQDQQMLFRMLASSPAFRSVLQQQALQGQQLGQNVTAGLARRGLTTSGVGTVAQSLGNAAGGFAQSQARGQLSGAALQAAQQNLMARLQAFAQMQGRQIGQPTGFGQVLGSGLQGISSLFLPGIGQPGGSVGGGNASNLFSNPFNFGGFGR